MQTAVYKITNQMNNKLYIGISSKPMARWSTHKQRYRKGSISKLYSAMDKYGVDNFSFNIITWCDSRDDANELEQFLIEECETQSKGYNITSGGDSTPVMEETKEKLRLINLGRIVPPETRNKISRSSMGKKKGPMTDDTKLKLSKIFKGCKHSQEAIAKIKASSTGRKYPNRKPQSKESREKAAITLSKTKIEKAKRVVCVETGEIYLNARQAANACGVSEALISMRCNNKLGGRKPKCGLTFRYEIK